MKKEQCIQTIINFLNTNNIQYSTNQIISDNKTDAILVDITIPSIQLGIDIENTTDASIDTNIERKKSRTQERALIAKKAKYGLIQITTHDFNNTQIWEHIKKRLTYTNKKRTIIGARQCDITYPDVKTRNQFLSEWHIQGAITRAQKTLALTYNNSIVALICAGKSRYESNKIEIIRYCARPDIAVTGGFEKLIKELKQQYNKNTIITSFSDLNYMLRPTPVYEKLFELKSITSPDYRWINPKTNDEKSRYSCMKHKLIEEGENPNLSEKEIMLSKGYIRVFGAGALKYELKI